MNQYAPDNLEYCPCGESRVIRYTDGVSWTFNGVETHSRVRRVTYQCPACDRQLREVPRPDAPAEAALALAK